MASEYAQIVMNLGIVIALIIVLVYIMNKFKLTKHISNKQIKILNSVSLGTKQKVILMEVNNTFLLLGATPNHIETLYVFDALNAPAEIKHLETATATCVNQI